jgi:hypothetical protein
MRLADGRPEAVGVVVLVFLDGGVFGVRLHVFDELDTIGVNAQAESLAEQPSYRAGNLDLVDARSQSEPEQPESVAFTIGFNVGVGNPRNLAQRRDNVEVVADGHGGLQIQIPVGRRWCAFLLRQKSAQGP